MATAACTLAWDYLTRSSTRVTSPFEAEEMKSYPVYFVPSKRFLYYGPYNNAFDDHDSRYDAQIGDHVQYRYEIEAKIGSGAFGDCWRCYDHKTRTRVALKMIRNERRFLMQGRIEVQMLENVRKSGTKSCVQMINNFLFRSHLCITFGVLAHDLYAEIKAREFAGFSVAETRVIVKDILECLVSLKEEEIVHADLKPENILFNTSDDLSKVTVIDLGSSCYKHNRIHTYIQSRYYRAPEIVLGCGYGCAVDMWSLGCVVGELLTARPMFPAKCEQDLLLYQQELLGLIPTLMLNHSSRKHDFFHESELKNIDGSTRWFPISVCDVKDRKRVPGSVTLTTVLAATTNSDELEDFLKRCLMFDPTTRMTPAQALLHPFITATTTTPTPTPPTTTPTTTTPTTTQKDPTSTTTPHTNITKTKTKTTTNTTTEICAVSCTVSECAIGCPSNQGSETSTSSPIACRKREGASSDTSNDSGVDPSTPSLGCTPLSYPYSDCEQL